MSAAERKEETFTAPGATHTKLTDDRALSLRADLCSLFLYLFFLPTSLRCGVQRPFYLFSRAFLEVV